MQELHSLSPVGSDKTIKMYMHAMLLISFFVSAASFCTHTRWRTGQEAGLQVLGTKTVEKSRADLHGLQLGPQLLELDLAIRHALQRAVDLLLQLAVQHHRIAATADVLLEPQPVQHQ